MYQQQIIALLEKLIAKEFTRFLVVGSLNTIFAYSIYFILNLFVHYQLAYGLAYATGLLFSYWLNTKWVFKEKPNWKSFLSFPFVYLIQYGLNVVMLYVLVELLYYPEWLSPLIVIVISIPVTFALARWVIRRSI